MQNDLWYALPLVISASLVYAATRHESMPSILIHAPGRRLDRRLHGRPAGGARGDRLAGVSPTMV